MGSVTRPGAGVLAGVLVAAFVIVSACGGGNAAPTNHVLVIDKSFDMKTADPQREFEVSGGIVAKSLYRYRKTTRLNSSHTARSYAVFCLKKKQSGRSHSIS